MRGRNAVTQRVMVVAITWAMLAAGFTFLGPTSPAEAAPSVAPGCDADGDGVAGGVAGQWSSSGTDDTATWLAATTGYQLTATEPGYRHQVPVCLESGAARGPAVAVNGEVKVAALGSLTRAFEIAALYLALQELEDRMWRPAPRIAPDVSLMQVVELETWLAIDPSTWVTVNSSATVGWVTVTATGVPVATVWEFSDETVRCLGPGVQYVPGAPGPAPCGRDWYHTTSVAPMQMEVRIEYAVTFQSSTGLTGGFVQQADPLAVYDLAVGEIQSIGALGTAPPPDDPGLLPDPLSAALPDCTIVALAAGDCSPGGDSELPESEQGGGGSDCEFSWTGIGSCAREGAELIGDGVEWSGGRIVDGSVWIYDRSVEGGEWIIEAGINSAEWVTERFIDFYLLLPGPLKAIIDALAGCAAFGIDAIKGIWEIAQQLIAAGKDPIGFLQERLELFRTIKDAIAEDPAGFAEEFLGDLAELELLEENPARWVGKIGCEIAVAIFTAGAAAGTGRIARLTNKIDDIKDWTRRNRRHRDGDHDRDRDRDGDNDNDQDNDRNNRPCSGNSFPTGTEVLMADGSRVPIEHVRPGDWVLTAKGATRVWSARPVLDQWSHVDDGVMATATLTDGSRITATDHHQFWVTNTGTWTDLDTIRPGDRFLTPQGTTSVAVIDVAPPALTLVWELDVAGPDNFAVSTGTSDVLVHNSSHCGSTDFPPDGQRKLSDREVETADRLVERDGFEDVELKDYEFETGDADFDYIDQHGNVYDQMGNTTYPSDSWATEKDNFLNSVTDHLNKSNGESPVTVVIDMTGWSDEAIRDVTEFVSRSGEAGRVIMFGP